MDIKLAGKVIVITGARIGAGRALKIRHRGRGGGNVSSVELGRPTAVIFKCSSADFAH